MPDDDTTIQRLCPTTHCSLSWQSSVQWREPEGPDGEYRCGYCGNPLTGYREL